MSMIQLNFIYQHRQGPRFGSEKTIPSLKIHLCLKFTLKTGFLLVSQKNLGPFCYQLPVFVKLQNRYNSIQYKQADLS